MSKIDIVLELELMTRIILASICGILIGYERKSRGKGAGIRTHMIVSLASALMMVVSAYAFEDADPTRIAAQIVSGIGFLGAGMIYVHKNSVSGLTTAAGIWATAGIGMAIGGGMYLVGIATTIVMILLQIVMHSKFKFLRVPIETEMVVTMENSVENMEYLRNSLLKFGIGIESIDYKRREDDMAEIKFLVTLPAESDPTDVLDFLNDCTVVQSINM